MATTASGQAAFSVTLPFGASGGAAVTATATPILVGGAYSGTSELSHNLAVSGVSPAIW